MERALLMSGIGGQGVQLAAATLAHAATAEGRDVQLFGSYGGMMRGGPTEATVIMADGTVVSPPTVATAWAAIVLHHEHAGGVLGRLRPGGLVFVNTTVVPDVTVADGIEVVEVPATELAQRAGNPMAASMVLAGACAAATGLVGLASLRAAARALLPEYRARHLEVNDAALGAGAASVVAGSHPAWDGAVEAVA